MRYQNQEGSFGSPLLGEAIVLSLRLYMTLISGCFKT